MNITPDRTIGSIVAEDLRTTVVFTAHGIDFCCQGGRTLGEACAAQGLDPVALGLELIVTAVRSAPPKDAPDTWDLIRLADHIEQVHHRYVTERTPMLQRLLGKLCQVHGAHHPELFDIARMFDACAGAMAAHMKKEELILFPFIKRLERARTDGTPPPSAPFGTVENPVRMMRHDHDEEGERFRHIARLSNGYTPPPDGCTAYRAAFAGLQEFKQDLHLHIHLENNILFPKALALEAALRRDPTGPA